MRAWPDQIYLPSERYDDDDLTALLLAASTESGVGPQALLRQFGAAVVPALLDTYGYLVPPQWRTLDLIENTEAIIHTALRASDESARPPLLVTSRRGPDEVVVIYASARKMCGLAKGIVEGVAAHYGEHVAVVDETCMLRGDNTCTLAVRRSSLQER